MASRPNGDKTPTQVGRDLMSMVSPPAYLAVVTLDGVPIHFNLFEDANEASEWATSKDVRDIYKDYVKEGEGHYVRMTVGVVVADTSPGLPTQVTSLGNTVQSWSLGKRPIVADIARKATEEEPPEKAATPKPTAAKKTTTRKKATTKKATSKKSSAAKPKTTTKKATSSGRKSPTKAVAKKKTTSRKKSVVRRSR